MDTELENALRSCGFTEASIKNSPASCVRLLVNDELRQLAALLYASALAGGCTNEGAARVTRVGIGLSNKNSLLKIFEELEL